MATRLPLFSSVVLVLVVAALVPAKAQDISMLLNNERVVNREVDCVLRTGPCDVIGRTLLRMIPEALNNNCKRCTPMQRRQSAQILNFMQTRRPNDWAQITRMYGRPPVAQLGTAW